MTAIRFFFTFYLLGLTLCMQAQHRPSQQAPVWPEVQLPEAVQKALKLARMRPRHQAAQDRGAGLVLDSTVTFYGYDQGQDTFPLERTIFTYLPSGLLGAQTDALFDGLQWMYNNRISYVYDVQGRVVSQLSEVYDPLDELFLPGVRIDHFYKNLPQEVLDSSVVYMWNDGAWELTFKLEQFWDAQVQRLLSSRMTFSFFGISFVTRDTYHYDTQGRDTLIVKYLEQFGLLLPMSEATKSYNDEGLLEAVVQHAFLDPFDLNFKEPVDQALYTYYPNGDLLQWRFSKWDPGANDWVLDHQDDYAYDMQGRTSSVMSIFSTGDEYIERQETYAYLSGEDLAWISLYYRNALTGEFTLDNRQFYYYAGLSAVQSPKHTNMQALMIYPNLVAGAQPVRLAGVGNAMMQVFNEAGQLALTQRISDDEQVSLSGLPPGLYRVVCIKTGHPPMTGVVIKQ